MSHTIPDAALDADIAILGKKGRGKTYVARGLVERLLAMKRRVLVLDPLSTWWGLRVGADGKSPGYSVAVFGGPHGDLAINEHAGRPLARVIASENLPSVIDLGAMRKAEQNRFVGDLLDELFARNRAPLTIVLEEADAFAPQQPMNDDSTRVLGEVDRIARRGRAYGFRLISISQRAAKLHKDVLTQLSVLVALGVTSPQDRDAIKAWVEGNADRDKARDVYASMAELKVGEGWVWAPDFDILERVRFPKNRTLDTSKTPEHGAAAVAPKNLADVDVAAVREALAQAQQQAEADDPKALRKRIAELEAEKRRAATVAPAADPAAIERAREAGYLEGLRIGRADGWADGAQRTLAAAREALAGLALPSLPALPDQAPYAPAPRPTTPRPAQTRPAPHLNGSGEKMPRAERLILTALAQYPTGRTKVQIAVLTGYAVTGGGFQNALGALRSRGMIDGRDMVIATAEGIAALGSYDALPHGDALLEHWMGQLGKAERSILFAVAAAYPATLTREQVAERAGYEASGGGFQNALGRLRTLELVSGRGELRASDALFG